MPTQPAPQPSALKPTAKPSKPSLEIPPPDPASAAPKPDEEGAIFRAFLDAGAGAVVAYTAERRIHTVVSEAVAPQLKPFVLEMSHRFDEQDRRFDEHDRRFDEHDRRFDQQDRKLDALAAAGADRDRRLDEHDRKLDVILARLDGLKLLGQIMIGAYALLITVLIAVFGFLFTS